MASGIGSDGLAAGDRYSGVENVTGSAYADTLVGNTLANVLTGGAGNQTRITGAETLQFSDRQFFLDGANNGPMAAGDQVDAGEDQVTTIAAAALLTNDIDVDGAPLTITGFTQPSAGRVTDNGDGTFSFDAAGGFEDLGVGESRTVGFTYRVTDERRQQRRHRHHHGDRSQRRSRGPGRRLHHVRGRHPGPQRV